MARDVVRVHKQCVDYRYCSNCIYFRKSDNMCTALNMETISTTRACMRYKRKKMQYKKKKYTHKRRHGGKKCKK